MYQDNKNINFKLKGRLKNTKEKFLPVFTLALDYPKQV